MKLLPPTLAVMALFAFFTAPVHAAIIGVDFGSPSQTSPANWTPISGGGNYSNLIDESGAATSVDLEITGTIQDYFAAAVLPSTIPSHTNDLTSISENIYNLTPSESIQFTFTGLYSNTNYYVWVFGLRDSANGLNQNVTINGIQTVSFNQTGGDEELIVNRSMGSLSNNLYDYAENILSAEDGSISITVRSNGSLWAVPGIAIEEAKSSAVPTLSEWGVSIFALLLCAMAVYRMRGREIRADAS